MSQTPPMPYFDPIPSVGTPSSAGPDPLATPALVAAVQQTGPNGQATTEDFSKMAVTQIEVVARTANPEFPNGLHTYIDITRSDDGRVHHQYIAADPVGGTPVTGEGGQLTYIEGYEKAANAHVHSEPLHAPPGMTLTQYGDKLVDGAKAYNAHPVRYDGLAEEGYNSNSFVSSLLIAKGGATASRDLEAMIAKGMHTPGPLRTDPNDHDPADFASRLAVGKRVDIAITASKSVEVRPAAERQVERSHDLGRGR